MKKALGRKEGCILLLIIEHLPPNTVFFYLWYQRWSLTRWLGWCGYNRNSTVGAFLSLERSSVLFHCWELLIHSSPSPIYHYAILLCVPVDHRGREIREVPRTLLKDSMPPKASSCWIWGDVSIPQGIHSHSFTVSFGNFSPIPQASLPLPCGGPAWCPPEPLSFADLTGVKATVQISYIIRNLNERGKNPAPYFFLTSLHSGLVPLSVLICLPYINHNF